MLPTPVEFTLETLLNSKPLTDTYNIPSKFQHTWVESNDNMDTSPVVSEPKDHVNEPSDVEPPSYPPPSPELAPQVARTCRTVNPLKKFTDSEHSSIRAYLSTFSSSKEDDKSHIIQSSISAYSEPHPLALLASHALSFVETDPDTMTLKEALSQPDNEQCLKP